MIIRENGFQTMLIFSNFIFTLFCFKHILAELPTLHQIKHYDFLRLVSWRKRILDFSNHSPKKKVCLCLKGLALTNKKKTRLLFMPIVLRVYNTSTIAWGLTAKKVNIAKKSKGTCELKNIVKMVMIDELTFINLYLHRPSMIPYISYGNSL